MAERRSTGKSRLQPRSVEQKRSRAPFLIPTPGKCRCRSPAPLQETAGFRPNICPHSTELVPAPAPAARHPHPHPPLKSARPSSGPRLRLSAVIARSPALARPRPPPFPPESEARLVSSVAPSSSPPLPPPCLSHASNANIRSTPDAAAAIPSPRSSAERPITQPLSQCVGGADAEKRPGCSPAADELLLTPLVRPRSPSPSPPVAFALVAF